MEGDFKVEEVNLRTALIRTTKRFSFTHLIVQEFLAARWFTMVFQFMAGVLSSEGNEELMEKLLDSPFMRPNLKMTCLNEYQNEKFIRNNLYAFCSLDGVMFLNDLSDVDCIGAAFVLDIISELNKGEAQRKFSDKFVTVKELELRRSQLTLSEIQRLYNSLNNEHCLVS